MSEAPVPIRQMEMQAAAAPLSHDHFRQIEDAKKRARKLQSAARFAAFNGWTLAIFAVVSACAVVFGDWVSLVIGAALGVFAFNEFRGGNLLKKFDLRGPGLLAWNQIALGVALVAYAIWSMFASRHSELLATSTGDPELDATVQNLTAVAATVLYGSLAAIGVIVPALTAWYYISRRKIIIGLLNTTEPWVIETLRAAA